MHQANACTRTWEGLAELLVNPFHQLAACNDNDTQSQSDWEGLVLEKRFVDSEELRILLLDTDGISHIIMCDKSGEKAIAVWRKLAQKWGLNLLAKDADGEIITIEDKIGAVVMGKSSPRGITSALTKRKSHFLRRRKVGINKR